MSNLTSWKSSLKEAHTKFTAINPEKATSELGFAMQIFQNSDALQICDPQSILNAVVNVARTSVTLNPVMRLAYLVPRKNKCGRSLLSLKKYKMGCGNKPNIVPKKAKVKTKIKASDKRFIAFFLSSSKTKAISYRPAAMIANIPATDKKLS